MPIVTGNQQIDGRAFHVLGECASDKFVKHAGLLARDEQLVLGGQSVETYESQPPLMVGANVGGLQTALGRMTPAVVGWVDDLSNEERHAMESWLEEVRTMVTTPARLSDEDRRSREYTIKDQEIVRDPDGSIKFRKFSCAGFVFWCYEASAIVLLDRDNMPPLDVAAAAAAYGVNPAIIPRLVTRANLPAGGPWRLMLPGYLFKALSRQANVRTPYIPDQADAYHP